MTPQLMDSVWQFERNWTLSYKRLAAPEPTATSRTTTTAATQTPSAAPAPRASTSAPPWGSSLGIPPILQRDVFEGLILPLLRTTSNLTDWDNGSATLELTDKSATSSYGHSSFETCRYACDIRSKCVQYVHKQNSCRMATAVRIGGPKVDGERGELVSGWLAHRRAEAAARRGAGVRQGRRVFRAAGDAARGGAAGGGGGGGAQGRIAMVGAVFKHIIAKDWSLGGLAVSGF